MPSHSTDTTDARAVRDAYARLLARLPLAEASDGSSAWHGLFADWNDLKAAVDGGASRLAHAFAQDLANESLDAAESSMRENVLPIAQEGDAALVAGLLASRYAGDVAKRHGEQLLRVLRVKEANLAPENSGLRVEEGALIKRYDKLIASGEVSVGGELCSLTRAHSLTQSDDDAVRQEAFHGHYGWYRDHRDELATIFDELVRLRDQMGRNLGDENYVSLGYARMERTDYGPQEAASFRASVREYVAPIFRELAGRQAKALGKSKLHPWDQGYYPGLNLQAGVAGPVGAQLDKMERAITRLSPRLAAHLKRMRAEDRIDLEERPGKAAGAYCVTFNDEPGVAILCNSTGQEDDIRTLTHELGHAFQGWESAWIEAVDLRTPTSDACEIHSMGMEFLCLPYLDEFFHPDELRTFARNRWRQSVRIIPWVTLADAFQHWVYENPSASPEEREAEHARLYRIYQPGIDWDGEAAAYSASMWYRVPHYFRHPFYTIDYALAETAAMQFAMLDAEDHDRCLATYVELCRLGGTESFTGLLKSAGLRSPFERQLIEDLMELAHAKLR